MGLSALAGGGIVLPATARVDVAVSPRRAGLPSGVMLPGIYVLAEPAGAAPWAGTLCTHWSHAARAPAVPCERCGTELA